jgi:hypothetical protein
MNPGPAFIAQRRHTIRTIVRLAALALCAIAALRFFEWFARIFTFFSPLNALGTDLLTVSSMLHLLVMVMPAAVGAAGLLYFERRIVAWLVPAPRRGRCPACDYDIRYATGGRCPECGLALEPTSDARS